MTEDNAVFFSSPLDPHAEHMVNLLMKSQSQRSITILGRGIVRNSSGTLTFFILSRSLGGTVLRFPYWAGT